MLGVLVPSWGMTPSLEQVSVFVPRRVGTCGIWCWLLSQFRHCSRRLPSECVDVGVIRKAAAWTFWFASHGL